MFSEVERMREQGFTKSLFFFASKKAAPFDSVWIA